MAFIEQITITVDTTEQSDIILNVLKNAEEEGEIDFPFNVESDMISTDERREGEGER